MEKMASAGENSEEPRSQALTLSLISISAALYAVAIAVTSPIPTPWGVGHFRPGVVVPAFFAVVFGPIVGGVGAAIGTFLGDFALSFFGLTTPLLSLIAGVPGNFVGFYLLGWLVSKRRTLASFMLSNFVALLVGNLTAALGVMVYLWFVVPIWAMFPMDLKIGTVMGLTLFWVATMIVFVAPLVPILVRYTGSTLVKMGVRGVSGLYWGNPTSLIRSSTAVALVLGVIYAIMMFIPGGNLLFARAIPPELLLLASTVVFATGLVFAVLTQKYAKTSPTTSAQQKT